MDIEKKAVELVNEAAENGSFGSIALHNWTTIYKALCRAIEAHEATKAEMEAFRREVSEAVQDYIDHYRQEGWLGFDHFIIRKPVHPLVQAAADIDLFWNADMGDRLEAALAARGLEIVKKEPSQ